MKACAKPPVIPIPQSRETNLALVFGTVKPKRDSSLRSLENHPGRVIPAKAGIHRAWVPASAGTTALVTFVSMGGPQAHGHSE
jgi:hypothetical protein